jgi:thiol:disulfide interchange protein
MKRYLVALLLALSLLMTGCFTTVAAIRGSKQKDPDGSTNGGAVVGYAVVGAMADVVALCSFAMTAES